jgi:predicted nucleic acid-binding protein
MVLIWGIQEARTGATPAGQDVPEMRRRAEILLEELFERKEKIVVPSVMVAELLVKIDSSKHGEFVAALQERFFCPPLDLRASAVAAELLQKYRPPPEAEHHARSIVKADVFIVATAKVAGATVFHSHDPKCRKIAELAGMEAKDLPVNPQSMFRYIEQEEKKRKKKN